MHRRPATLIHIVLASLPLSACSTAPNRDFPGVSQPYIAQPHLGDQSLADTHLHRKEQKSRIAKLIKSVMEKAALPAVEISVPLVVEARAADNWDAAH